MIKFLPFKLKFLIFEIIVILLFTIMALYQLLPNFNFTYSEIRFVHILGAILLIGNILTGAFWLILTDLKKSPSLFQFTIKTLNTADIIFTAPGALLLIWSGSQLIRINPEILTHYWLRKSIFIFTVLGLLWSFILVPLQIQFELLCNHSEKLIPVYSTKKFKMKQIIYFIAGGLSGILSINILVLMVFKR